jgi:hypothetical protein
MRPLTRYFEVEFLNPRYSFQDLFTYGSEQIVRLAGGDMPALIAPRITATQDAMSSLDDLMADNTIKIGLQKGKTAAKDAFRASLPAALGRIYGAVLAGFGDPSAVMVECFPSGRAVFSKATDEQLNDYLAALSAGVTAHATGLTPATVTAASGLLATWTALFQGLKSAKGSKKSVERTRQDLRRALAIELHINVCTLSLLYPGDLDKAAYFCPQDKLDGRAASVTPGAATLTLVSYNATNRQADFTMSAEDAESFRVYRRLVGEADFSLWAEDIVPVDGVAAYSIGLNTAGNFEFVAEGVNGARAGERSAVVLVEQAG